MGTVCERYDKINYLKTSLKIKNPRDNCDEQLKLSFDLIRSVHGAYGQGP